METNPCSADVFASVRTLLVELSMRPAPEILPETSLDAGLGLDSLAMINLTVAVEERFHVTVPPSASAAELGIVTVGDLARFVETLIPARRAS